MAVKKKALAGQTGVAASAAPVQPEVGGAAGPVGAPEAEAAPPPEAEAMRPPSGLVLVVIGPQRGRRRAGRAFGPEPVSIPLDELSNAEIAAIDDDPELVATIIEADDA